MARIRSIKPEIRTSEKVNSWPVEIRYFWIMLWGYVDDQGKGRDNAKLIAADAYPLDDAVTHDVVEEWLGVLHAAGVIYRYAEGDKRYLAVVNWREHQRISHPARSVIPDPPEGLGKSSGGPPEDDRRITENGSDEQGAGSSDQGAEEQGAEEPGSSTDAERPEIDALVFLLADLIEANGSKRPASTTKARDAVRLMIDRDNRTPAQIEWVIRWCQADDFWKTNILSMPKLREKFDQLRLAGQRSQSGPRDRQGEILKREMEVARAADAASACQPIEAGR